MSPVRLFQNKLEGRPLKHDFRAGQTTAIPPRATRSPFEEVRSQWLPCRLGSQRRQPGRKQDGSQEQSWRWWVYLDHTSVDRWEHLAEFLQLFTNKLDRKKRKNVWKWEKCTWGNRGRCTKCKVRLVGTCVGFGWAGVAGKCVGVYANGGPPEWERHDDTSTYKIHRCMSS